MAIRRQELGIVQPTHVEGERRARGYANLLMLEYGLGCTHHLSEALTSLVDPRPRTYFVHQLAESGFSYRGLLELLSADQPPSLLYAILLALAEFDSHQWTAEERLHFERWVVEQYQQHSDVGIHGMCRWYLRQWKRQVELQALDAQLATQGLVAGRQWYVHRLGITMGIFAPPSAIPYWGEFNQRGTFRRLVTPEYFTLPQPFAISLEEITVEQYQPFANAMNAGDRRSSGEASLASDELPMVSLSWEEALGFCQWLSEVDGFSPVVTTAKDRSMRPPVHLDFTRSGYRLPKFAECLYAFGAGAISSRCFGTALSPFENRYVEFPTSAEQGMRFTLRPNRFGILHAMDNVAEWTATGFHPLQTISQQALVQRESYGEGHRILTTGSSYIASNSILFTPQASGTDESSAKIGFRLCRSMPMDETTPVSPTTWNPPGSRSGTATVAAASRRGSGSMPSAGSNPDDNRR
jgi:formylglycine-generating enzyme required for sulfatase activity